MYALRYSKQSVKVLRKMPQGIATRLQEELRQIAANPAGYAGDWKPLAGTEFWRLRVGGWRAICDIENGELVILVLKIAPRGDAYK